VSDFGESLAALASGMGQIRAALVLETTGIEVAAWGKGDFDIFGAELSEVWKVIGSAEFLVASSGPEGAEIRLALGPGAGAPPGKVRLHAAQWAHKHREEFS
jgi:hypothetical protein